MKNAIAAAIFGALTGSSVSFAEANHSWVSSVRTSRATTEGSAFNILQVESGVYFDLMRILKPGLSVNIEHTDNNTNLFDTYYGGGINADLLIESPEIEGLLPFMHIRVPIFHRFQAGGKITRHITNGIDRDDGSIEFPSDTPGTRSTTSPRIDNFGYELKGQALGFGIDLGCALATTEHMAIRIAAGYSWRNLVIMESNSAGYSMGGSEEYAYDQRHGLKASGATIEEGFDVEPDRKSRFFGAASLAIGIDYKI